MEKTIKKYGDSNIITLTKDDLDFYKLKTGDRVKILLIRVIKKKVNIIFNNKEEINWLDLRKKNEK